MNELLKEWQERLGLSDWRIVLTNSEDLDECDGFTEWTECNKTAKIAILSPEKYGDRIIDFDKERILVHELLHLKFTLLDDARFNGEETTQYRHLHQLIDDIARAMVCAKRGIGKIEAKTENRQREAGANTGAKP